MSDTWLGLIIGGSALGIGFFMVIVHYRHERIRAGMLRNLKHHK